MPPKEQFANIAHIDVTEGGANTITAVKLDAGIAVFQRTALVLHQIEFRPNGSTMAMVLEDSDTFAMAITTSDSLSNLERDQAAIVDLVEYKVIDHGTAANDETVPLPFIHNFCSFPSGGIIVPGNAVYATVKGTSLAGAGRCIFSLWFSYMELKAEDYYDLMQASQALIS